MLMIDKRIAFVKGHNKRRGGVALQHSDCARLPKPCAAGRRFGKAGIAELKDKT